MKIKAWEAALAVALVLTFVCSSVISFQQDKLNDKLIRLHVVANSDSEEDQTLKLKVRDAVLNDLEVMLENAVDKSRAAELITAGINDLEASAKEEIKANGYDYPVSVTMKEELFPTREYDTFSLPAGTYDSLRITIGEGGGQNWWCVVFPPVCAASSLTVEDAAAVGLTKEEFRLITEDSDGYVVKFRFMELLGKLKGLF